MRRLGATTVKFLYSPTERRPAYTGGHGAGEYSHVDGSRGDVWVSTTTWASVAGALTGTAGRKESWRRFRRRISMTMICEGCYPPVGRCCACFCGPCILLLLLFPLLYTISPVLVFHVGFSDVGEWNLRWEKMRFRNCRLAMLGLYDTPVIKCSLHWAVLWNARGCYNFQYMLSSSLINSSLNSSPSYPLGAHCALILPIPLPPGKYTSPESNRLMRHGISTAPGLNHPYTVPVTIPNMHWEQGSCGWKYYISFGSF